MKQRLKRWEIQDVVKHNLHAVDIISEDLEYTKKILEKVSTKIYWRGFVDIRRYKGIIFQRWREASLIVSGSELVIDYSPDHEDRMSPDDAISPSSFSPPTSSLSTVSSLSLSGKFGSQRTALMTHSNSNGQNQPVTWMDGPIRRQLRLMSSGKSRRIINIPLHHVRSVHLNKVIGENGLEHEITIGYIDDTPHISSKSSTLSSATCTTTSTTAASVILNNSTSTGGAMPPGTSFSMCSTIRSQSMMSGISSFGWHANEDTGGLDDRDSFCQPDVSGKLRTVFLRQLNTGGGGGLRANGGTPTVSTSPVDYFPYVVKSLNTDIQVLCTLNGSPTHFQDPTYEELDLDELFSDETDEEDGGHPADNMMLAHSHRTRRATVDNITGHQGSYQHPDEEEEEQSPSSPLHDQDDMNLEEDANGLFGRSPVDRNSSSTGFSSNLSNLFRAVSGRSSMSSSIGHHSSGATSMESVSTLASAVQQHTRRNASQLTGIEEEDDSHNNSFTGTRPRLSSSASSASNSIITSPVVVGKESTQHSSHNLSAGATSCPPALALVRESSLSNSEDFWRTSANLSEVVPLSLVRVRSNSTDHVVTSQARNSAGDVHTSSGVPLSPRAAAFLKTTPSMPAGGVAVSLDSPWRASSGESFLANQTWRYGPEPATSLTVSPANSAGASSAATDGVVKTAPISSSSSQSIKSRPQRSQSLCQSSQSHTGSALFSPSQQQPPAHGTSNRAVAMKEARHQSQQQQQQYSNHSLSSLPSPYRLRGRRVKLRERKYRAVAIDDYRTYRSPYLHDSMAAQIDFVPVLRFLLERTKAIRDEMKEKLHFSIMYREELKQEYEYLFSLRKLAGNPPQAPTSVFSISAEHGTATLERAATLLNLYTDHIDEASQFQELLVDPNTPSSGNNHSNSRNSPTRRSSTTGVTSTIQSSSSNSYSYNTPSISQSLVSAHSPHHQCALTAVLSAVASSPPPLGCPSNGHSNSGICNSSSSNHVHMAVTTESSANVLEARELLRWLTRSEHGLGEVMHVLHQQMQPQPSSSSGHPQSVSSHSASQSTSSVPARQTDSTPFDQSIATTTPIVGGKGDSGSICSTARVSPWRGALHRAMISPADINSMRVRLQYEEEDGQEVSAKHPPPNPAHSPTQVVLQLAPDHWTQENPSLTERKEDSNEEDLLDHSPEIHGIQSWRSRLGPPPPAYRRYFEKYVL